MDLLIVQRLALLPLLLWASTAAAVPENHDGEHVEVDVLATYGNAITDDVSRGALSHEGTLRLRAEEFPWLGGWVHSILGDPTVAVDGELGWAAGGYLVDGAHVTLGLEREGLGIAVGFGTDAIGDRISTAWTVPVDLSLRTGVPRHARFEVGVMGGPRFAVAGAERRLGWRVALQLTVRDVLHPTARYGLRDARAELAVERIDDARFITVAVGFAARTWWGPETVVPPADCPTCE